MSNAMCEEDGCNQVTVAKCMHCDNHLCLKCLTRHQQPLDSQLCQLTNDMNKLLSLSSINHENKQSNHPEVSLNKQYMSVLEQIDLWEITMTKKLNDLVSHARHALKNSYEQISFEIEEWSTERQCDLQQLAENIGKYSQRYARKRQERFSLISL